MTQKQLATIIYYDAGNDYRGEIYLSKKDREKIIAEAKNLGHVGYLSGRKVTPYVGENLVLCFFKEAPNKKEINRRRKNGFLYARWNQL